MSRVHAEYRAEGWTRCDVMNQESYGNGRTLETMLFERNDMLTMTVEYRDENDNPIGESETIRIPVGENFDLSLGGSTCSNCRLRRKCATGKKATCRMDLPSAFGRRRNADADGRLSGKADSAGSESGWQPMRARVRLGGRRRVQQQDSVPSAARQGWTSFMRMPTKFLSMKMVRNISSQKQRQEDGFLRAAWAAA